MRRLWLVIFAVVFILFAVVDFLLFRTEAESWWQKIPCFFAIFGLIFCILIVIVSKFIGHLWLQRKEDYYDRNANDD